MALPFGDNVYTKFFTPKEYQVELLDAAKKCNIVACIGNVTTKTFISLKLIQELTISVRRSKKRKFTLFISESVPNAVHYASAIKHLTDLHLLDFIQFPISSDKVTDEVIAQAQVIMTNSSQAWELISNDFISLDDIFLLIVDDCHFSTLKSHPLHELMKLVAFKDNIRIFGMIYPLYTISDLNPGKIEADLNELQEVMHCRVETASDIVSILRYNCKPTEFLCECDTRKTDSLDEIILEEIQDTVEFLKEHRYDPSEIYEGDLLEELKAVPDPTEEPLNIINDFLDVLNTMGAWCANKAALSSLFIIEKLKLKTPYERHFLLLCVVSSLMLRIRTIFEDYFSQYTEKEQVYNFVSPKMKRLIEILLQYKPSKRIIPESNQSTNNVVGENDEKNVQDDKLNKENIPANQNENSETLEQSAPLTICDSYIRYKNDKANRWKNKKKFQNKQPHHNRPKSSVDESEIICSVIFVKSRLIATVIHYLLSDLKKFDNDNFWWLSPQFTTEKTADPEKEPRDAEIQHRNLEDVLRKFRTRECNILIGTSMLEEGIDFPKCNLVIGFDPPTSFRSYIYSKSKASANNANFFLMYELPFKEKFVNDLAKYYEIEQLLLKRCFNKIEKEDEISEADQYSGAVIPYSPPGTEEDSPYVSLDNAVSCINRYCAKLPSDSFTRLTPMWSMKTIVYNKKQMYVTTLRLPINSPYKKEITGHPMPTEILSKRIAALEACRLLHRSGELDNNLQPIGKESFHLLFSSEDIVLDESDLIPFAENADARPGTNKRRQYYKRKIAYCLMDCRPMPSVPMYLYTIKMILSCPLPEEQNTRGRRIHPPEESPQGFGILLTKKIPKVCPFPIFTRCGEVIVSLEMCSNAVYLSTEQLEIISTFLNYTFTKVLRLNKYFMAFDSFKSPCTYFIIPTLRTPNSEIVIDWDFLHQINQHKEEELKIVPDEERKNFKFCKKLYADAVVMPSYRNQDFPQHFYVAEICTNLTPKSKFPGDEYKTFEEYYFRKYQLRIQNVDQPLLDVDHTSARLNFLTPRYVNRKGVALPTCSEATKKAKRESLEQKQILVPELCQIHLFPASLWRKAVALPCILYRLNCLLIAEEIRYVVSREINLGLNVVPEDFQWPFLDFGWTLADVVKRTRELKEQKALKENSKLPLKLTEIEENAVSEEPLPEEIEAEVETNDAKEDSDKPEEKEKDGNSLTSSDGEPLMEIGTWSNEMANDIQTYSTEFENTFAQSCNSIRYGSPTSWLNHNDDDLDGESITDSISSDDSFENPSGIRIEFKSEFLAEAVDRMEECADLDDNFDTENTWQWDDSDHLMDNVGAEIKRFEDSVTTNKNKILTSGRIYDSERPLALKPFESNFFQKTSKPGSKKLPWILTPDTGYGIPDVDLNPDSTDSGISVSSLGSSYDDAESDNGLCVALNKCNVNEVSNDIIEVIDTFSFDYQPDLVNHVGPSPSVLLQALTMSNANDGINLERLETIGDSFLKYAITNYLYCTYDNVHEGKLSHIRSKQVSNLHLYKLGKKKIFGECMVACKFEPHDNWLPPCFRIPVEVEKALIEHKISSCFLKVGDLSSLWSVKEGDVSFMKKTKDDIHEDEVNDALNYLPFHLITYHSIPDKSIADCVEALIGAYLISCGIRGAMLFMSWLGIKVLPVIHNADENKPTEYGYLNPPPSPLIRNVPNPEEELERLLVGYDEFERILGYHFNDRSYLLQAMTHASYSPNRITDCYQRLEFLGDAVLDYLITRHLYEDKRQHSPGALTDLRSALVNNTIFAALAIRFGFHKYFRHLSPGLADVIHRFVRIQEDNNHTIFEEYYLINEEECEEVEDVEVPKALGDIFESVAGAIFLDSGMSLDAVWSVYHKIMKNEIELFSTNVPKSPIRELLELEPETAKFGRPEKLADGRRVRVTVEVFGKGIFKGIGRNYRIAKCTAAKCALKQLKKRGLLSRKTTNTALD
ncbi:endoribonuclease Dcr-1 [Planococcus citri]|uniref:endoribonuclease Dcr-1 n=1 Tax=Planococcus citri TaxID=170843 RepID=UPI0031F8D177